MGFLRYAHLSDSKWFSFSIIVFLFVFLCFFFLPERRYFFLFDFVFWYFKLLSLKGRMVATWLLVWIPLVPHVCLSQTVWLLSLSPPFSSSEQLVHVTAFQTCFLSLNSIFYLLNLVSPAVVWYYTKLLKDRV